MTSAGSGLTRYEASLLERAHQLRGGTARRHPLVVVQPLQERPAQERVLVGPR